jgi:NAD(P)-dependent dehydrogenase (short-subunit alcohol dehydrogenase family)
MHDEPAIEDVTLADVMAALSDSVRVAIVRGLAAELGKYGIRANSIAPGYIKTGFMTGAPEELQKQVDAYFSSRTPIARPGYPEDFEAIAAYLASDSSSFHTADTIVIDGGSLINPV